MPTFGRKSKERLGTLDEELQSVLKEAIKSFDFSIIWGHRGMAEQNEAHASGASQLRWPQSKHNSFPSTAVDIVPYPGLYEAPYEKFFEMATYVLASASRLGVPLTWGGHWLNYGGPGYYRRDWAHFEMKV